MHTIKTGDIVKILPQFQDDNDNQYIWVAVDDESKGRVSVTPINSPLSIKPTYLMSVEFLTK